jgi:thiamine-monophosphate kinase
MTSELSFLANLRTQAPRIGDDCAVIPMGSRDLLFTTDLLVEDVHFRRTTSPESIGGKAIVRSLSDIAAMGGTPKYCLLSIAVPEHWPLEEFYTGALAELKRHRTELIGGDLSRTDRFTCDTTICGEVPHGKALLRRGAHRGDGIYVSGPLGASAARNYLIPPVPRPRLELGRALRGYATSCMDLSDGLSIDLHRLSLESNVEAHLDNIPAAPGASEHHALHGGEDYELLFTMADRHAARFPGVLRIGSVHAGTGGSVYLNGTPLPVLGHDHFAQR